MNDGQWAPLAAMPRLPLQELGRRRLFVSPHRPSPLNSPLRMPFPDTVEGVLGQAYAFERELGGGGMSRVFLAEERALGRKVVIKVLPEDVAGQVSVERFRREIALAAQLSHPHIVPLLNAGEVDGRPYFTMPYVTGESLRARLAKERELPVGEAIRMLREVASALAFAHQHGVVHRDIKPDNVLLAGGAAMVTDFGVAKAVSASTGGDSGLTSLGVALGTPAYMAPEQATADPLTDHRADIYAWGVLAYEMLTGSTPFAGRPSQAMLAAHVTESPTPVAQRRSSVPDALAATVMHCLEKRPADRPQSALELVQSLDSLATPTGGTLPTQARTAAAIDRRRQTIPRVVIGAATALVLGAGAWSAWRGMRGSQLDPRMVAVVPFENLTSDPALGHVGRVASDWIMEGIAQTDSANVVASTAVEFAIGDAKPGSTDIIRRIASTTRAGTVVTGTVSKFGDSLRVQASVIDARAGKVVSSIPPVSGPASDPLVAITALRERLLGAIVSGDVARGVAMSTVPPKYSAYNEYIAGAQLFPTNQTGSRQFFRRAIELDSGFAAPYGMLAAAYVNAGQRDSAQALVVHLDRIRARLSPSDRLTLDYIHAMIDNDREAGLRVTQELYRRTADPLTAYLIGLNANSVLRPDVALPALAKSDSMSTVTRWAPQVIQMAEAYHQAGDYAAELAQLERGRRLYPNDARFVNLMLRPFAGLRQGERALALADTALRSETNPQGAARLNAVLVGSSEFRAHGDSATALALAKLALQWCESHPVADPPPPRNIAEGRALVIAGLADSAQVFFKRAAKDTTSIAAAGFVGMLAARAGDRARALAIADSVGALQRPFLLGVHTYWRAVILAALGERDQAVQLLRLANQQGQGLASWHYVEQLTALRGYPPFEAMITVRKPK
jgi:TolB-like protein/tetratricopeptide (TPR) repeat protein